MSDVRAAPDRAAAAYGPAAAPAVTPTVAEPPPAAPPAADAPPAGGLDVPRDTTPTWEVELLVSGAVLFGLFQVPPVILDWWNARLPHLTPVGGGVGWAGVALVVTLFHMLIGCFVLHLALRAYWVALVGTHSVFPHGVRWDKQREYGPIQSRLAQERVRPLPEFISRVDNAASLVFATGFALGATVLASGVMIGAFGLVLWGAVALLGVRRGLLVAGALYFPTMLVLGLAPLVDYKLGGRLAPHSRAARVLTRLLQAAQGILPGGVRSMATVLTSNVPKRVAYFASTIGFVGAMGTAFWRVMPPSLGQDLPGGSNFRFFNGTAPGAAMYPLRYAGQRGPWEASLGGPSIDGEVVNGPYLRLFVPYRPGLHNEALPAACPGLRPVSDLPDEPTAATRAAAEAVLACAARVHRVQLDGRPVGGLRYHFVTDPAANRRGFVAFVPVTALAAGEHLLEVWPARRPDATGPVTPYAIPFWK